jgi:hypothetical protein
MVARLFAVSELLNSPRRAEKPLYRAFRRMLGIRRITPAKRRRLICPSVSCSGISVQVGVEYARSQRCSDKRGLFPVILGDLKDAPSNTIR